LKELWGYYSEKQARVHSVGQDAQKLVLSLVEVCLMGAQATRNKALKGSLRFSPHGNPTTVTLDISTYIDLLVKANVTDPALWPPAMKGGASALARIREIEAECIARHGEFDWEKLPESVQDEYDSLCAFLDNLRDTGERIPLQ
jgi:hypothetical protein